MGGSTIILPDEAPCSKFLPSVKLAASQFAAENRLSEKNLIVSQAPFFGGYDSFREFIATSLLIMTMENQPFEDVFPIKNGEFQMSC